MCVCVCVCGRSPHDRSVWMENCVRARRDKQSVRDSARESSSSSMWPVAVCASAANEGQWQGCCVQWPEPQQHGPRCVFKVILIPRRFAAACVCGVCAGVRVPSAQGRSSSAPRGIGIQISVVVKASHEREVCIRAIAARVEHALSPVELDLFLDFQQTLAILLTSQHRATRVHVASWGRAVPMACAEGGRRADRLPRE